MRVFRTTAVGSAGGTAEPAHCIADRFVFLNGVVYKVPFWRGFAYRGSSAAWGSNLPGRLYEYPILFTGDSSNLSYTALAACPSGWMNTYPGGPCHRAHEDKGVNIQFYDGSVKWRSWPQPVDAFPPMTMGPWEALTWRGAGSVWYSPGLLDVAYGGR